MSISHDTVVISELPIGKWTEDYKAELETLMEDKGKNGKKKKPIVKIIQIIILTLQ